MLKALAADVVVPIAGWGIEMEARAGHRGLASRVWFRLLVSHSLSPQIYVMDRDTGAVVATFSTEPFFCFHTINSFEDPDSSNVLIYLIHYPNVDLINELYLEKIRSGEISDLGF